jgi:hypothetical protein
MRLGQRIGLMTALALALAATGASGQHVCQLENRSYPENVTVCSGGLVLNCTNGTWQNNDGARCGDPSGSYLGPRRPLEARSDEPIPEFYREQYPWLPLP